MISLAGIIVAGVAAGSNAPDDRVAALGARIRCPICTGESIADSPSETAGAMMEIVAEQVEEGKTDDEILAFFRARYGDIILLDPPIRGLNLALWLLPALALAIGVVLGFGTLRNTEGRSV